MQSGSKILEQTIEEVTGIIAKIDACASNATINGLPVPKLKRESTASLQDFDEHEAEAETKTEAMNNNPLVNLRNIHVNHFMGAAKETKEKNGFWRPSELGFKFDESRIKITNVFSLCGMRKWEGENPKIKFDQLEDAQARTLRYLSNLMLTRVKESSLTKHIDWDFITWRDPIIEKTAIYSIGKSTQLAISRFCTFWVKTNVKSVEHRRIDQKTEYDFSRLDGTVSEYDVVISADMIWHNPEARKSGVQFKVESICLNGKSQKTNVNCPFSF